ncbi:MAG: RDD family protein [Gammaproteobacteria bacterium]|nr:RDD family protein [Gammaproteobacteria bacterium]
MTITYDDSLEISSAGGVVINLPIAGLGSRSYAFVIDWHIRALLAFAWFILVVFIFRLVSGSVGEFFKLDSSAWNTIGYFGMLPAFVIYFLYHPILEITMKGRTPGKRMAGVRIVSITGGTPTLGALLTRNLFRLIDCLPNFYLIGIASCFLTKKQVRIGDIAAHTLLVHEEKMRDKSIQFITEASRESVLNHNQIEVLQDLLDRWNQLQRKARITLARQLLANAEQPLPDNALSEGQQDKILHASLKALSKEAQS